MNRSTTETTMHACVIRPMVLTDLDAVYAIERAANAFPWARSIFEDAVASTKYTVVITQNVSAGDEVILGFAVVSYVVGEAELLNIVIDPKAQGKGLGKQLLDTLIKAAISSGNHDMYLEVRVSNVAAIHLYEQAGFIEVGRRPNYYPIKNGREDALLMALPLAAYE